MIMEDDHGYREDWDMTTEEGSLCFASCIHARLVGGEQDESDLTWLANYLRVNSSARTALSQPEPEGPTVMEIIALADEIEAEELGQVDLVLRALARCGRPAVEPETNGQT